MNQYEERQEAKRQRLEARAKRIREEAARKSERGWRELQAIPFGQPILVGHHSEKADRSYRSRAIGKIDKSVELHNVARELEERAERIGTGGISSDDPDALQKLEAKLLQTQETHALMIERNREARAIGQPRPYAAYQLSNSNGNIASIKKRIASLQNARNATPRDSVAGNGWRFAESIEENRYMFTFDAIPSEQIRQLLRSRAFKWSPSRNAWVRQRTGNARFAVDHLLTQLET